jgi:hypothetical protein
MNVSIRERQGKTVEELMGPDDNIVFRCMDCQEFLLPRELHQLKRRAKDTRNGLWTWDVKLLCPICFPDPHKIAAELEEDEDVSSSPLLAMTKEKLRETRAYERAGLLAPQPKGNGLLLVN